MATERERNNENLTPSENEAAHDSSVPTERVWFSEAVSTAGSTAGGALLGGAGGGCAGRICRRGGRPGGGFDERRFGAWFPAHRIDDASQTSVSDGRVLPCSN